MLLPTALSRGQVASLIPSLSCIMSFSGMQEGEKSYSGYQILRVGPVSPSHQDFETVQKMFGTKGLFDFMTAPLLSVNRPTDAMICPEQAEAVKGLLDMFQVPYQVAVSDVQSAVDHSKAVNAEALKQTPGMNWNAYQKLAKIQSWMDDQARKYPSIVSLETIGKSYEGRALKVMKISVSGFGSQPAVWVDGGIHAREWISSAVASFIGNRVIQMALKDPGNPLVANVDWYIVPNMNPDGYEFTWNYQRMWRKTRSRISGSSCRGVDPNRNFDFKWGGEGTSDDPCEEIYCGPKAASETETKAIQNYIYNCRNHIKLYIGFHSYSQLLMHPWAYATVPLGDRSDIRPVAESGARALQAVYGTHFYVGTPGELIYNAAGGAFDWVKGVAGIKFAYTFELRDTGNYGFLLPPNQIIPSGNETFAAVAAMTEDVMRFYGFEGFE